MKTHKEGEPRAITIAVNGPKGCGKTTVINHIKQMLTDKGYDVIEIDPGHSSEIGLRQVIKKHDVVIGEFPE